MSDESMGEDIASPTSGADNFRSGDDDDDIGSEEDDGSDEQKEEEKQDDDYGETDYDDGGAGETDAYDDFGVRTATVCERACARVSCNPFIVLFEQEAKFEDAEDDDDDDDDDDYYSNSDEEMEQSKRLAQSRGRANNPVTRTRNKKMLAVRYMLPLFT